MWRFIFGLIPGWLIRSDHQWLNTAYLWSARQSYSEQERESGAVSETFARFCLDHPAALRGREEAFRRFLAEEVFETTVDDLDYGELRAMLPAFQKRRLAAALVQQQAGKG